jgi:NNP family nitrate/nitrite transporter-like MFS transporter
VKDNVSNRQLALATLAFAVAFANWGLIAGLAPLLKPELQLTATQASLMIAIPVILGSLGRIPVGLLTDRYGGRLLFSGLLIFGLIPTIALAFNHSYSSLLFWGFWLGLAAAPSSSGSDSFRSGSRRSGRARRWASTASATSASRWPSF